MSGDDDADRQHAPSEKRLADARRKGEIPRSADVTAAAAIGGFLVAIALAGPGVIGRGGQTLAAMIDRADRLAPLALAGGPAALGGPMAALAVAVLPLFVLPATGAVASLFAQRGVVFAPEKLRPRLSRISPLANAKQKFGPDGLFDFAKSCVKMTVAGVILWLFVKAHLPEIVGAGELSPGQASRMLVQLTVRFLLLVLVFSAAIGALDMIWQWQAHLRRNRMSRQEVVEEFRDSEGDPHMKQRRRQRGQDIAMSRMIADVAKADVVIVNPTHYAVALRWKRSDRTAPVCLAKGTDGVAARIRSAAAAAGVPMMSDPPTARAIHATVEVGAPIRPEQYQAVAAAIRFSEKMRARARARGWSGPSVGAAPAAAPGAAPQTARGAVSGSDSGPQSGPQSGRRSGPQSGPQPGVQSGVQSGAQSDAQPGPHPDAQPGPQVGPPPEKDAAP